MSFRHMQKPQRRLGYFDLHRPAEDDEDPRPRSDEDIDNEDIYGALEDSNMETALPAWIPDPPHVALEESDRSSCTICPWCSIAQRFRGGYENGSVIHLTFISFLMRFHSNNLVDGEML